MARPAKTAPSSANPERTNQTGARKRKRIDYERIEAGWRAGLLSPRQLAAQYTEETGEPVSHAAIIKHFERRGVPRDLSARIRAKSDAMVTAAMVTQEVTPQTVTRDREIVDSGAAALTEVRLTQRRDIQRSRRVAMALLAELEQQTGEENVRLLEALADLLYSPDEKGVDRLNDLYRKVISLPERARTMKSLADSLRVTVDLERQAYGLDADKDAHGDPLARILHAIASGNGNGVQPVARDPDHEDERA